MNIDYKYMLLLNIFFRYKLIFMNIIEFFYKSIVCIFIVINKIFEENL